MADKLKVREKPNDDFLLKWSEEHLYYEIKMFQKCSQYIPVPGATSHGDTWHRNVILEGLVLHFRNLYDFFFLPIPEYPKFFNDARAQDFYDNAKDWEVICPTPSPELSLAKKLVGSQAAHLSYERPLPDDSEEQVWAVKIISEELFGVVKLFVQNVPSGKLHQSLLEFG